MVQDDTWFVCDDGARLYLRRWLPDRQPAAVVHIAHGMAEHSARYKRLAERLCEAGIEVWAADQRGHGKTADLSINTPDKGGLLGHCADTDAFPLVTNDIGGINREIQKNRPSIPLFLMGHSWGSFIVQNYIENEGGRETVAGCILSGTRGPANMLKMAMGKRLMAMLAIIKGQRKGSLVARAIVDGSYNRPFRPNRTLFDWISRDEAEVDKYVNDPFSGKLCSVGFYRDLTKGLCQIHRREAMAKIRQNLPIYVFYGSADPVGEMGSSPAALVNKYRSLGIQDLEFNAYPGARHETLNETNRDEVTNNLLSWINRHTEQTTGRE
ncbi:MAG: lysophospholipase [Treponema sp.]|nr:lysophospholipase [Treponema sp.]